jgi:hypothetical protein
VRGILLAGGIPRESDHNCWSQRGYLEFGDPDTVEVDQKSGFTSERPEQFSGSPAGLVQGFRGFAEVQGSGDVSLRRVHGLRVTAAGPVRLYGRGAYAAISRMADRILSAASPEA